MKNYIKVKSDITAIKSTVLHENCPPYRRRPREVSQHSWSWAAQCM